MKRPSAANASTPAARHRLIRFGRRPLLAIPDAPARVRLAAVGCLSAFTWKRAAVRSALTCVTAAGADRWLFRHPVSGALPPGGTEGLRTWLEEMCRNAGTTLHAAILWPPEARRARLYAHLLDDQGRRAGFAKLAMDEANSTFIRNEGDWLERLAGSGSLPFSVPAILARGRWALGDYVAVKPLPPGAVLRDHRAYPFPADAVETYLKLGSSADSTRLEAMAWFHDFQQKLRELPAFAREFAARVDTAAPAPTASAHGDMGGENLFLDGDRLWIIDWERAGAALPAGADRIGYWLGARNRDIKRDPRAAAAEFRQTFFTDEEQAAAACRALAWHIACSFWPATEVARDWPNDPEPIPPQS